jgi:hypothetical protein
MLLDCLLLQPQMAAAVWFLLLQALLLLLQLQMAAAVCSLQLLLQALRVPAWLLTEQGLVNHTQHPLCWYKLLLPLQVFQQGRVVGGVGG